MKLTKQDLENSILLVNLIKKYEKTKKQKNQTNKILTLESLSFQIIDLFNYFINLNYNFSNCKEKSSVFIRNWLKNLKLMKNKKITKENTLKEFFCLDILENIKENK